MLYPITFSIPECKILPAVTDKKRLFAQLIPGDLSTYIYGSNEKSYYEDYAQSVFGITHEKAGWDCMRHYEILANGCIPWFKDLDGCPPNTMTHFPKQLVKHAMTELAGATDFNTEAVRNHALLLLSYTRENLTTKAMARYVLNKIERKDVKNILFLSWNIQMDYMRDLLLHGFKEIFGVSCHDYPCIPHLYTDFPESSLPGLYGCGMSISRLLDKIAFRDAGNDRTVGQDIVSHRYDLIVYGSVHRTTPYWDLVHRHYASKDVILICGEDLHQCEFTRLAQEHDLFLREF